MKDLDLDALLDETLNKHANIAEQTEKEREAILDAVLASTQTNGTTPSTNRRPGQPQTSKAIDWTRIFQEKTPQNKTHAASGKQTADLDTLLDQVLAETSYRYKSHEVEALVKTVCVKDRDVFAILDIFDRGYLGNEYHHVPQAERNKHIFYLITHFIVTETDQNILILLQSMAEKCLNNLALERINHYSQDAQNDTQTPFSHEHTLTYQRVYYIIELIKYQKEFRHSGVPNGELHYYGYDPRHNINDFKNFSVQRAQAEDEKQLLMKKEKSKTAGEQGVLKMQQVMTGMMNSWSLFSDIYGTNNQQENPQHKSSIVDKNCM